MKKRTKKQIKKSRRYVERLSTVISIALASLLIPAMVVEVFSYPGTTVNTAARITVCCSSILPIMLLSNTWLKRSVVTLVDAVVFIAIMSISVPFVLLAKGLSGVVSYLSKTTISFIKREGCIWK